MQNEEEDKTYTVIDLGDDLLEGTKDEETDAASAMNIEGTEAGVTERLKSARILITEGLLEDAKKTLFRIVSGDTRNIRARQMLQEVHQLELRQIFSDQPERRSRFRKQDARLTPEQVLNRLDEVLGIVDGNRLMSDFMREDEALKRYTYQLEYSLEGAHAREKLDVGIAFLEMGLCEVALPLFRKVSEECQLHGESHTPMAIAAAQLIVCAYLEMGRPFEATLVLEPVLQNQEIPMEEKTEAFYLMARCYERMGRGGEAWNAYQLVRDLNPDYRDVKIRIQQLGDPV